MVAFSDGKPGATFPENALLEWSHFRTENREPLFLKMLLKARAHRRLLLAPALHRRRYAHRLAILGDGAAGDLDSRAAQPFHDGVVREHATRALGIDELLDSVTDRLRGMGFAAVGGRDRRGKKVLQLENAAAGRHVFVGGDA